MGKRFIVGVLLAVLAQGMALVAGAAIPGTDLWEPSLARTPGQHGSQWYATVWIHNPGTQTAHVAISFLVRDQSNPSPAQQTVTVDPGETLKLGDVFLDLFGLADAKGALRFQSDRKIVVAARSYNLTSAGIADSQGQFVAGMPTEIALGSGEKTSIPGITNPADGSFRSNFAMVETAGGTANVEVTLYDRDGVEVASKTYPLSPYEPMQVSMHAFNSGAIVDGGRWDVEVLSGSGKVLAFASMVGSGSVSQDPSTLEMEYELTQSSGSGLTQVAHDASLAGDGTSSSPLGIADGGVTSVKIGDGQVNTADLADRAVTAAKISGAGASGGQVLKFGGTGVTWATDEGLTLPYLGSTSSSRDGLSITSSGASAIVGETSDANSDGVLGITSSTSNGSAGVVGMGIVTGVEGLATNSSGSGVGIHGVTQATSGAGVYGSVATNSSALYGVEGYMPNTTSKAAGVFGRADASSGMTYGVYGENDSATNQAAGIFGESRATSGVTYGVHGMTASTTVGTAGVKGESASIGVLGHSDSSGGVGVRGEAPYGGIEGEATSTSGDTIGVWGIASSAGGAGVWGTNNSTGSGAKGVVGETNGDSGWASGVYGTASAGGAIGVTGWNTGTGPGLYAWSENGNALVVKGTGSGDLAEIYDHAVGLRWKVTSTGDVYADGSFHSGGADFAEMYPANAELAPGTVVGIGTNGKLEPATARRAGAVMGVVSDKPTIVGGVAVDAKGDAGKIPVAILGIVKVRASAASGPIGPGDLLTPGSIPGTAVKAVWAYPGTIIGKALEALPSGTAMIRMLVTLR